MLHHYILRPQADQLRAVGLLFDDGLHDELTEGSALNAVNTEGYRNDEFKAIHIIADAVVLPDILLSYRMEWHEELHACLLSFLADELPTLGVLTDMMRIQFLYIYIG